VHHTLRVQVLKALQHLRHVNCHERLRERTEAVGLDDLREAPVLCELQDDVKVPLALVGP